MSDKYFFSLRIIRVNRLTKDSIEVTFDVPADKKHLFSFEAGQYITIRKSLNGEELRRSYSLCTGEGSDSWAIAIKKVENGRFSSWAMSNLNPEDELEVMAPAGNFTLKEPDPTTVVCFAAGSGITPVLSHIRSLLNKDKGADIRLFYGNRNFESIMFRDELEALKNKHLGQLSIHHIFSREKTGIPILHGRIDKAKCMELAKHLFETDNTDAFLICGPNDMIFEVREALEEMGVPPSKIHFELFNTDGLQKRAVQKAGSAAKEDLDKVSTVEIQMDGDVFEFNLAYGGQNLLDAALENGADLPFACKGGVCSTCKARITEGKVEMDLNYALEPYELEAGYVLLCQSHPRSSHIYIDFDQK